MRSSGTWFSLILGWFWNLLMLTFWLQDAWHVTFFGRASRTLFYRFLNRNFNSRDSKIEVFAWMVLQKSTFHQNRFLWISDSHSVAFREPWEPILRFPNAFKTSSKTSGFLVMSNVLFKAPGSCRWEVKPPRPQPMGPWLYRDIYIYIYILVDISLLVVNWKKHFANNRKVG